MENNATVTQKKSSVPHSPPKDPCNMVYIIFYWLGMGSLLPWNFFISVSGYWMYKFRNVTASATVDDLPDNHDNDHLTSPLMVSDTFFSLSSSSASVSKHVPLTALQLQWNSLLSVFSMVPNVTFLLLNAVYGHRFRTQPRLVVAMVVILLAMGGFDAMARIDTDSYQQAFLYATLAAVVVVNIMVAIFQGGLSGVAAKFPHHYMGSVVQGQALGGVFAALANVLTLALGAEPEDAAFYCFLVTIFFLATALVAFAVLTRSKFYRYYFDDHHTRTVKSAPDSDTSGLITDDDDVLTEDESATESEDVLPVPTPTGHKHSVLAVANKIKVWIVAVFLTFMVTLSVFPAITGLVVSTQFGQGNRWHDVFFAPVGCFLLFNVCDYGGRLLAGLIQWPRPTKFGGYLVLLLALLRVAFIPLFVFSNASPKNRIHTQVVFDSDALFLVLISLFGASNGYLGSVSMMFAPKTVSDSHDQSVAASIMIAFLMLGLAVGSVLSTACLLLL